MSFREMLRKNKSLSKEEISDILRTQKRGVLSVNGDNGYPYGMPMNFLYDEDGCIYFHQGKVGHRLESIRANDKVSFCVYDNGEKAPDEWAYTVKSVIVFGHIQILDDLESIKEISKKLSLRFTTNVNYIDEEISKFAKATLILKLVPEHVTGKRIKEE